MSTHSGLKFFCETKQKPRFGNPEQVGATVDVSKRSRFLPISVQDEDKPNHAPHGATRGAHYLGSLNRSPNTGGRSHPCQHRCRATTWCSLCWAIGKVGRR